MARSLNGTSDKINATIPTVSTSANGGTVSLWIYPTDFTGAYSGIYSGGTDTSNIYVKSNGKLAIFFVGTADGTGTNTLALNTWYHILVVVPSGASGTSSSYVNGSVDATFSDFAGNLGSAIQIGDEAGGSPRFFGGSVADVAVWSTALTATEVAALASGIRPYRIRRSNLVAYWPLEGSASPEPDVIGGNNGTLTGTSNAANPFNYTTPKYGSRSFNGSTDKIVCSNSTGVNFNYNNAFSVAAWVNFTSGGAARTIFGHLDTGASYRGWDFFFNSGNQPELFLCSVFPTAAVEVRGQTVFSNSTWYHVCATYTGSGVASGVVNYTNGVAETPTVALDNLASGTTTNSIPVQFGQRNDASLPAAVKTADAAIWNVALSAAEVARIAAGFRPHQVRPSGLVAYWPLEGTASPEPDMIAGNNGTLTGTSAGASPTGYKDIVGA